MQISDSSGAYSASFKTGMDYAVAVAGKAKSFNQQQGAAALTLIDSASQVSKASGAEVGASVGYGSRFDVTA